MFFSSGTQELTTSGQLRPRPPDRMRRRVLGAVASLWYTLRTACRETRRRDGVQLPPAAHANSGVRAAHNREPAPTSLRPTAELTDSPLQYSTSKSRTILGFVGPQWEERIVAELDSALNNWLNSLPAHRMFPSPFLTFFVNPKLFDSQVGPTKSKYNLSYTVRRASRGVLQPADNHPPAFHRKPPRCVRGDIPADVTVGAIPEPVDMHERSKIVCSCL